MNLRDSRRSRDRDERGAYYVLLAFLIVVLLAFCALIVGIGYLTTNKTRIQNTLNLAALSAIEKFTAADVTTSYLQRANDAKDAANKILRSNRLAGASHKFGDIVIPAAAGYTGTDNVIKFGEWLTQDPDPLTIGDCDSRGYPCFLEKAPPTSNASPLPKVSAIRIEAGNQQGGTTNPIIIPFAKYVFGKDRYFVRAEATAARVGRCVEMLLDLSGSTTSDTHLLSPFIRLPPSGGPFTVPQKCITDSDYGLTADASCNPGSTDPGYYTSYWNELKANYPERLTATSGHFRDDYQVFDTSRGRMAVDVRHPQRVRPLADFLLGYNAAVRYMMENAAAGDKVALVGFAESIIARVPASGLTSKLGWLAQITNYNNILPQGGLFTPPNNVNRFEREPNFVSEGFFPLMSGSGTSLPYVMHEAITDLSTNCSADDRKIIIVASDGISNVDYQPRISTTRVNVRRYNSSDLGTGRTYTEMEDGLLGTLDKDVFRRLSDNKIVVVAFHSGAGADPHLLNRKDTSGRWLDFTQAVHAGFLPMGPSATSLMWTSAVLPTGSPSFGAFPPGSRGPRCDAADADPTNSDKWDACAWSMSETIAAFDPTGSNVRFRRAGAVLAQLAAKTGGIYVPMLPVLNASNYDANGNMTAAHRENDIGLNNMIREPLKNMSPGESAASAAVQALGSNPFTLVIEPPALQPTPSYR